MSWDKRRMPEVMVSVVPGRREPPFLSEPRAVPTLVVLPTLGQAVCGGIHVEGAHLYTRVDAAYEEDAGTHAVEEWSAEEELVGAVGRVVAHRPAAFGGIAGTKNRSLHSDVNCQLVQKSAAKVAHLRE